MLSLRASKIQVKGTEVVSVPLFNVLNGKRSEDYVARVEPSALGGQKMARYLLDVMDRPSQTEPILQPPAAPSTSFMSGRS